MTQIRKRGRRRLVCLPGAFACIGTWAINRGRFLIDVPAGAAVTLSREMVDGFKIDTIDETEQAFRNRIAAREAEISRRGDGASSKGPEGIVETYDPHIASMIGRTLIFGRAHTYGFERGRRLDVEWVSVETRAHLNAITPAFASMPGGNKSLGLLGRNAGIDAEAHADELLRVTKLRLGKRAIKGVIGDEVLERGREFNVATTCGFMREAQDVMDDPSRSFISLELHGGTRLRPDGRPADTSLDQDAGLALWGNISSSVRLRDVEQASSTWSIDHPAAKLEQKLP
jgi:hypothetical protein